VSRALEMVAVCAALYRGAPSGAALETALIAAVIADRHPIPVEQALALAEQDRWDPLVVEAAPIARRLIEEARGRLAVTA
jgi:hypothetical protein